MATLYRVQCFVPCYSHNLFLKNQRQEHWLSKSSFENSPTKTFRTCACSLKKSRSNRKVRSNVELCNQIREFLLAVGLPEGHVPSLKEFSDHGRTDLANIVRRRGYKVIRDLLSSSTKVDVDVSNGEEKLLTEGQDATGYPTMTPLGQCQDEKVTAILVDGSLSAEVPITKVHPGSTYNDPKHNSNNDDVGNGKETDMLLDSSLSTEVPISEVHLGSVYADLNHESGDDRHTNEKAMAMLVESSLSTAVPMTDVHPDSVDADLHLKSFDDRVKNEKMMEETLCYEEMEDEDIGHTVEGSSFSTSPTSAHIEQEDEEAKEMECFEDGMSNNSGMSFDEISSTPVASQGNSLEEKVAKFIQSGDLDAIEDDVHGTSYESKSEDSNVVEVLAITPNEEEHGRMTTQSAASLTLNGSVSISSHVMPPKVANHTLGNDKLSTDGLPGAGLDTDMDAMTLETENQVEINHLKFILHQKELELSQLKEQIEREKLALSALQTKAEEEITNAQRLISEKDAELLAAEESLAGLVEVRVQYCGEGEIVEVAGSFNGWHHRIKLDPLPSSTIIDSTISRKPRLWSTMLWLYPGVYEIKFIVDGHWRLDPQAETVHKRGITNNVLRVER